MDFIYFNSPKDKEGCFKLELELKSKGFRFFCPHYLKPDTLYRSNIANPSILIASTNVELERARKYVSTYVDYLIKNNEIINIF